MDKLNLYRTDRRSLVWTLVAGEILATRGQPGPLARLWKTADKRNKDKKAPSQQSDTRPAQG